MFKFKMLSIAMLLMGVTIQARYISIKNDSQFFDEINKFEFALVCFIQTPTAAHNQDDKFLRKNIKLLEKTIEAVADTDLYRHELKHEVGFLVIDTARKDFDALVEKYHISIDEMPQFLLFKNGKIISSLSGEYAKLIGYVSKSDILDFINDYFGKAFDTILEKKEEEKQEEKELQIARYAAFAASRYPYDGYAPYNANGPYSWYGYNTFYRNSRYWDNSFFLP